MSILSFNHFDFALMFGKVKEEGEKQGRMHKTKFWRQFVHNIIIVVTNLGCENLCKIYIFNTIFENLQG